MEAKQKRGPFHGETGNVLKTDDDFALEHARLVAVLQLRRRQVDHVEREIRRIDAEIAERAK